MLLRIVLTFLLAIATPLAAQDMTDAERDAFRAEVRAYLLENPEVLMEAIEVLETREQQAQEASDAALATANRDALTEDGFSFVGGNPDGDITLVEFMDYRCGYCKRAFPEVEELIASDGNIRYIIKEFPILGEQSVLASRFAIATKRVAGDDAYKDVHNTLMEYRGDITPEALDKIAQGLALDAEAILAEMPSDAISDIINANRALAQDLAISGTPTFVVDTQLVRGYIPLEQMRVLLSDLRG